jgi:hypothetical protein
MIEHKETGVLAMDIKDWREAVSEDTVRDYANGKISWREIRNANEFDDFNVILATLRELGLRLPRANAGRDAPGKQILADLLRTNSVAA